MDIFYIAVLTLFASTIGTISGFGISTIMIPVLVMFFPPVEAIFLVAIIHWFGDVWKVLLFRKGFHVRLFLLFGVVGVATSYFGASVSLGANEDFLLRTLGAVMVAYAVFLLLVSRARLPATDAAAVTGGALSGFFAGVFGIGGPIRSAFLSAFDLPKAKYIATAGAIGLVVDVARIATYVGGGATLPRAFWYGLLIFIPVSYVGALAAKRVVHRIPQKRFRGVIAMFLFFIGLKLMW